MALDDDLLRNLYEKMKKDYPLLEFRAVGVNLGVHDAYMPKIIEATEDIDISLLFVNAGFIVIGVHVCLLQRTYILPSSTTTLFIIIQLFFFFGTGIVVRRPADSQTACQLRSECYVRIEDHSSLPQQDDRKETQGRHLLHIFACW